MRHRVTEFQKVLNRAKMEGAATERKTARCVYLVEYFPFVLLMDLVGGQWYLGNSKHSCQAVTLAYNLASTF
jgi:hypothetical protein